MATLTQESEVQTLNLSKSTFIKATPERVFASVLEQMGPGSEMMDGTPFKMKLEAWPGGRWFRDLGNNAGHLWGHVQVIKPPMLLEITGPLFMSYPAISHLQYRVTAEGAGSKLTLTHTAMGLIPAEHREGVQQGWDHWMGMVQKRAEGR